MTVINLKKYIFLDVIALTNQLRLSYEANEQITTKYDEKIRNLNDSFEKSIFILLYIMFRNKIIKLKLKVKIVID